MEISKLTTKHQATIPKAIRTKLALQAGDLVQFQEKNGQVVITKVEKVDHEYLGAVGMTLESEWLSDAEGLETTNYKSFIASDSLKNLLMSVGQKLVKN